MAYPKNILVVMEMEERHLQRLIDRAAGCKVTYAPGDTRTEEQLQAADAVIGSLPADDIKRAKNLKWLQVSWAGVDNLIAAGIFREGLTVTNISGAFGQAISEHMLASLLMLYKRLHLYRDNQNRRIWRAEGTVETIQGKTALVVGLGDIGGAFAKLLKLMGATVIGVRRADLRKPDTVDELYLQEDLDHLLPRADIVGLCLPSTAKTIGLLSRERIGLMKEGAVVLNVGRGSAIDTEALCDALESGKLLGAALDVTEPEPLPAGHRLWGIPNAQITPHVSGMHNLYETYLATIDIFEENLGRYVRGEELINLIDPRIGYRKTN